MRDVLRAADLEVDRMFMSVAPSCHGSDMGVSPTLCASITNHPGPQISSRKEKELTSACDALTKNANPSPYPVTKFPSPRIFLGVCISSLV
jgi:hypothetical protein